MFISYSKDFDCILLGLNYHFKHRITITRLKILNQKFGNGVFYIPIRLPPLKTMFLTLWREPSPRVVWPTPQSLLGLYSSLSPRRTSPRTRAKPWCTTQRSPWPSAGPTANWIPPPEISSPRRRDMTDDQMEPIPTEPGMVDQPKVTIPIISAVLQVPVLLHWVPNLLSWKQYVWW